MDEKTVVLIAYIIFVWLVVVHTLEEIACDVYRLQFGHIKLTKNKYLLAASGLTTLNMDTLALLVLGLPIGTYLGLFTTAVLGVLQGAVHTVGYFKAGREMRGLGAGFYSAIPLAMVGVAVFVILLRSLI